MTEHDAGIADLLREVRARVPLDAAELLAKQPPERIEAVLGALPSDEAAGIAAHLPGVMPEDVAESGQLASQVPGEISELMEPALGVLSASTTAAGAVDFLARSPDVQQITYLYVTDTQDRLVGLVVMRDLLLAKPAQTLSEIMLHEPFSFHPDTPIGDAVRGAVHRHYPVYPVIDDAGKLVGQVRGWKLFERQAVEIAAQSGAMVGLDKAERVNSPFFTSFRQRHPWLLLNLATAFMAAFVVGFFEDTIARIVALAVFLPVLAGQSGNTGCQALAITLRGMTLGDLNDYPVSKLLRKEILLGALNGFLVGIVAGIAMYAYAGMTDSGDPPKLAFVILLAMTGSCIGSGIFGVLVPVTLKRFGADPATASSIFLTTFTDIIGMGLMLLLATTLVL